MAGSRTGTPHTYLGDDPRADASNAATRDAGVCVSAADAAALAAALARALPHIPTYEVTLIKRRPLTGAPSLDALTAQTGAQMWSPDPESEPIEFFSGRLRQQLRGVIGLCQRGAFAITCNLRRVDQLVTQPSGPATVPEEA